MTYLKLFVSINNLQDCYPPLRFDRESLENNQQRTATNQFRKYLIWIFVFIATTMAFNEAKAQTDPNRPLETIAITQYNIAMDQAFLNAHTASERAGYFADWVYTSQESYEVDYRLRDKYLIHRWNPDTTNFSGSGNMGTDAVNFNSWVTNPSNNCDNRDFQIFQTGVFGYEAGTSTIGPNPEGWIMTVSSGGYDWPIVLAHEVNGHGTGAVDAGHQQARMYITFQFNPGSGWITNDGGKTIGAPNSGGFYLRTFTVPIAHNSNSIVNGGDGYWHSTYSDNQPFPLKVAVDQMYNNTGYTDVTQGIWQFYEDYPDKIRQEVVAPPSVPLVNINNDQVSLSNVSDYDIVFPNTTDPAFEGTYYTEGVYCVHLYDSSGNLLESSDNLNHTFTGLANGDYTMGVYEKWSNSLTQSSTFTIDVDNIPPTPTITTLEPDPTNAENFLIYIAFDEEMNQSSLQLSDFSTSNCSVSNLSWADGANCELMVTPNQDGTVGVNLPQNSCTDLAGNGNVAAEFSIESDQTNPYPELNSDEAYNTNATSFEGELDFNNEPNGVTGVEASDFYVENGTVSDVNGSGSNYTYLFTPAWEGPALIRFEPNSCMDAASNENVVSENLEHTIDWTSSFPQMLSDAPSLLFAGTYVVTVEFYNGEEGAPEEVIGFTQDDITATNCVVSNFTGSGSFYSFDFTPIANGSLSLGITANTCQDLAGNDNNAAFDFTREVDLDLLTPSLSSDQVSPTNAGSFVLDNEFSEAIDPASLSVDDYETDNCELSDFTMLNDSLFQITVNYSLDGVATITLSEGSCSTTNGKENIEGSFSIIFDQTPPQLIIDGPFEITIGEDAEMTYTANEPIIGFDNNDIEVDNGSSVNFMGSGDFYTSTIIDAAVWQTHVNVTGEYFDEAGNSGLAVEEFTFQILTGTTELFATEGLKVYPNPAKSSFFIESEDFVSNLIILNATGQLVLEKNFPVPVSKSAVQIDISELQKGIYFIKTVSDQGNSNTCKIIKE